jgi:tetratricopeptide (TPR) repeat protein
VNSTKTNTVDLRHALIAGVFMLTLFTGGDAFSQANTNADARTAQLAREAKAKSGSLSKDQRESARQLFASAFGLMQKNDFKTAKVGFERALAVDPADAKGQYYYGETLISLNEPAMAKEHFALARELSPNSEEGLKAEARLSELQASAPSGETKAAAAPHTTGKQLYAQALFDTMLKQRVAQGQPDTPKLRNAIHEELNTRELLAREAQMAHMTEKPEVEVQMELAKQTVLVSAYLAQWTKAHPITDAELREEYDSMKASRSSSVPATFEEAKAEILQRLNTSRLDRHFKELRAQNGL